jgi:glycosyltransferase involved in cell wall biosynthesis
MPAYNGEMYIGLALESICAQDEKGIECIVIDDGSSDRTVEIATSFSGRLALTVVRAERRANWVAVSNDGLRMARAPFVCFLHQDDYWLTGRTKLIKSMIDRHPDAEMIVHAVRFVDRGGKDMGPWTCPLEPTPTELSPREVTNLLLVQNFIAIDGPVFRTASARRIGGMDERLWYTADWDLWLRLVALGKTVYSPDYGAVFRLHGSSLTVSGSARSEQFERQILEVLERHLTLNPGLAIDITQRAQVSAQLNVGMALAMHGEFQRLSVLLLRTIFRGPVFIRKLLRETRLHERVIARLRARI